MPHNLDAQTRRVIVSVAGSAVAVTGGFALYAQTILIPRLKARIKSMNPSYQAERWPTLLFLGTVGTVLLQLSISALLTAPIVIFGRADRDKTREPISSSINFCEEDFVDALYIAEPANSASSLACYIPFALLGLIGPPSRVWAKHSGDGHRRFAVAYSTLLAIGFGSTFLHAFLTAKTQGGDELPMLWFTASTSYCALDIMIEGIVLGGNRLGIFGKLLLQSRAKLRLSVFVSSTVVTAIYCVARDNFLPFYIMFTTYAWIMIVGILSICLFINWENVPGGVKRADLFRAHVLIPIAVSSGSVGILAVIVWVSEMLFCVDVTQNMLLGDTIAPWLWNRAVHPMWHAYSGLLAWLLIQVLIAAQGMQRGWGDPILRWYGAPYVDFEKGVNVSTTKHKNN